MHEMPTPVVTEEPEVIDARRASGRVRWRRQASRDREPVPDVGRLRREIAGEVIFPLFGLPAPSRLRQILEHWLRRAAVARMMSQEETRAAGGLRGG